MIRSSDMMGFSRRKLFYLTFYLRWCPYVHHLKLVVVSSPNRDATLSSHVSYLAKKEKTFVSRIVFSRTQDSRTSEVCILNDFYRQGSLNGSLPNAAIADPFSVPLRLTILLSCLYDLFTTDPNLRPLTPKIVQEKILGNAFLSDPIFERKTIAPLKSYALSILPKNRTLRADSITSVEQLISEYDPFKLPNEQRFTELSHLVDFIDIETEHDLLKNRLLARALRSRLDTINRDSEQESYSRRRDDSDDKADLKITVAEMDRLLEDNPTLFMTSQLFAPQLPQPANVDDVGISFRFYTFRNCVLTICFDRDFVQV